MLKLGLFVFLLAGLVQVISGRDASCYQPIIRGPCRAAYPMFGYDATRGRCVKFTYGGCDGNANQYYTMAACRASCEY